MKRWDMSAIVGAVIGYLIGAAAFGGLLALIPLVIVYVLYNYAPLPEGWTLAMRVFPGPFGLWGNAWLWLAGFIAAFIGVFALPSTVKKLRRHKP